MRRNDLIVKWVIDKINNEYKDDVSLLLTYGSYVNGTDNSYSDVDFYFIPKTDRAYELCKTFIIEGIGFDLFPMSWERVESIADLKDSLTPLLADVKILFSNSEEDVKKFKDLQNILQFNLNNKPFMLKKANSKVDEAFDEFRKMILVKEMSDVRLHAGNLIMLLSESVAYANQTYFSRGLKMQIEDLSKMKKIPDDFLNLYDSIIKTDVERFIMEICFAMIKNTIDFLNENSEKSEKNKEMNLEELASFYEEAVSTWNKIEICCDNGNYKLAYISGVCLQKELNYVTKENGLSKFDIMSSFNSSDLSMYKENALKLKDKFKKIIEDNGRSVESYDTVDEFIRNN